MSNIILNVKGMMCEGCENRIKNVIKNIDGVDEVKADYESEKVIVILNKDIDVQIITEAIEEIGYEVAKE